jgi:hypothetical protein
MHPEIDEDGRFDGAILIDPRGYGSLEGIEIVFHTGDRPISADDASIIVRKIYGARVRLKRVVGR